MAAPPAAPERDALARRASFTEVLACLEARYMPRRRPQVFSPSAHLVTCNAYEYIGQC